VDGYMLPASVREVVAQGKHNDVPVLTGANLGELGGISGPQAAATLTSFTERARRTYGPMADEYLKLYPAATDEQAAKAQVESSRDQSLVSLYLWARERAKTSKTPAYIYLWDHTLPGPDADRYGAFHTSEVPYVLNTLYASDRPFTDKDRAIAEMMSSYWANFATSGNPNGKGLPTWNPTGAEHVVMEVGDKTAAIALTSDPARFAFFEKFLLQPPAR